MAKSEVVKHGTAAMLDEMIQKQLDQRSIEDPKEVVDRIIEQNLNATTLDELFVSLLSAKDEFVNIPFICEAIDFQESTIGDSPYYAVLSVRRQDDSTAMVSCSAPDVYSKLLAMRKMGVMEETPVVITSKPTRNGYSVLKLNLVDKAGFEAGDSF
ncbi:MAG: hypothetical protein JSR64_17125 [Nitrospira sp.]|nr:hypothetical protein [Nitrospira sp.]